MADRLDELLDDLWFGAARVFVQEQIISGQIEAVIFPDANGGEPAYLISLNDLGLMVAAYGTRVKEVVSAQAAKGRR